ncbi:MAG: hypothetical protein JO023_29060 [Chloroflexi bacterium]|nr:hypothetical protein [Chloroflexota bacterium]
MRSRGRSPLKIETHLHSDVRGMLGACRQVGYAVRGLTRHALGGMQTAQPESGG